MTRNTKRTAELYKTLSAKQRASLAVESLAAMNKETADFIAETIPYKTYRQRDYDFCLRVDRTFDLAAVFGLEWFRYYSNLNLFNGLMVAGEEIEKSIDKNALILYQSRLAALNDLEPELCSLAGVEAGTLNKIASLPCYQPNDALIDDEIKQQYKAEMMECFAGVFGDA